MRHGFFNQFLMEIKRSLLTYGFWCTIILVPFICILSNSDPITQLLNSGVKSASNYSVIYLFNYTTTDGWFINLIFIIAMLPAGLMYYFDKREGFNTYTIIRNNVSQYGKAMFASIITITWFSIFTGLILLVGILCTIFPISNAADMIWEPYNVVVTSGHPLLFFLIKSSILSSLCATFVACAVILSTLLSDCFVLMISPFLIYYFADIVTSKVNERFSVSSFTQASINLGTVTSSFIATHLILLIIIIFLGIIFVSQVERNVEHADI